MKKIDFEAWIDHMFSIASPDELRDFVQLLTTDRWPSGAMHRCSKCHKWKFVSELDRMYVCDTCKEKP